MGLMIEDGMGSGHNAEVSHNRLRVLSIAGSLTDHVSVDEGQVYTIIGAATPVVGTATVLFIQNNDPTNLLFFDRIFVQVVGIATLPAAADFFELGFGRTFTSGGADTTPVNQNRTSTNIANGTFKTGTPALVMAGTFVQSNKWFAQANGVAFEQITPRADDIILGRSNTLEIRYNSAGAVGTAIATAKFYYATPAISP